MDKAIHVARSEVTEVHNWVDVTNVVGLSVVVPGHDFDDIWFNLNGLLPTVLPEPVRLFYPVLVTAEILELPGRNSYGRSVRIL